MPSTDVQNMIPQIREYLATQPVERAYLFGSCSRGEERPDSDVDILVALDHSKPIGMRYFQMITDLEDKLGRTLDLVTEDGHFNILRTTQFPKLNLVTLDEFLKTRLISNRMTTNFSTN